MKTYWNGEEADCRKVTAVMADNSKFPLFWGKHLVGKTVKAVEVNYCGSTFYLFDDDGEGWWKVTERKGSPSASHSGMDVVAGTVQDR